jgi:hypothetical protein
MPTPMWRRLLALPPARICRTRDSETAYVAARRLWLWPLNSRLMASAFSMASLARPVGMYGCVPPRSRAMGLKDADAARLRGLRMLDVVGDTIAIQSGRSGAT